MFLWWSHSCHQNVCATQGHWNPQQKRRKLINLDMRLSNPCLAGKFTPHANVALVKENLFEGTNPVGMSFNLIESNYSWTMLNHFTLSWAILNCSKVGVSGDLAFSNVHLSISVDSLSLPTVQHKTGTTPARNIFSVSVRSDRNMPAYTVHQKCVLGWHDSCSIQLKLQHCLSCLESCDWKQKPMCIYICIHCNIYICIRTYSLYISYICTFLLKISWKGSFWEKKQQPEILNAFTRNWGF